MPFDPSTAVPYEPQPAGKFDPSTAVPYQPAGGFNPSSAVSVESKAGFDPSTAVPVPEVPIPNDEGSAASRAWENLKRANDWTDKNMDLSIGTNFTKPLEKLMPGVVLPRIKPIGDLSEGELGAISRATAPFDAPARGLAQAGLLAAKVGRGAYNEIGAPLAEFVGSVKGAQMAIPLFGVSQGMLYIKEMAQQAIQNIPHVWDVITDPKSTTEDKIDAVMQEIGTVGGTVLGAHGVHLAGAAGAYEGVQGGKDYVASKKADYQAVRKALSHIDLDALAKPVKPEDMPLPKSSVAGGKPPSGQTAESGSWQDLPDGNGRVWMPKQQDNVPGQTDQAPQAEPAPSVQVPPEEPAPAVQAPTPIVHEPIIPKVEAVESADLPRVGGKQDAAIRDLSAPGLADLKSPEPAPEATPTAKVGEPVAGPTPSKILPSGVEEYAKGLLEKIRKEGRVRSGMTPEELEAHVITAAAEMERWSKEMADKYGDDITSSLKGLYSNAAKAVDIAHPEDTKKTVGEPVDIGKRPTEAEQAVLNRGVEDHLKAQTASAQMDKVSAMTPEQIGEWSVKARKNKSSPTDESIKQGISIIGNDEMIKKAETLRDQANAEYKASMDKMMNGTPVEQEKAMGEVSYLAAKRQYFSEMVQAANGNLAMEKVPEVIAAHKAYNERLNQTPPANANPEPTTRLTNPLSGVSLDNETLKSNKFQAGTSTQRINKGQNEASVVEKKARPNVEASINWLESVGKDTPQAVRDSANTLLRKQVEANPRDRNILGDTNARGAEVRTQGNNGTIVGSPIDTEGISSPQESQRAGQPSKQSSVGKQRTAQQIAQSDWGNKVVSEIRALRGMSSHDAFSRGTRTLQEMLSKTTPGSPEESFIINNIKQELYASDQQKAVALPSGKAPGPPAQVAEGKPGNVQEPASPQGQGQGGAPEPAPRLITGSLAHQWAQAVQKQALFGGDANMLVHPQLFSSAVINLMADMEKGTVDFAKWSKEMKDKYGPDVVPALRGIYLQSQKLSEGVKDQTMAAAANADVERIMNNLSPAAVDSAHAWQTAGEEAVQITKNNPEAARLLVGELNRRPRPPSDTELALLDQRVIQLSTQHTVALREAKAKGEVNEYDAAKIADLEGQMADTLEARRAGARKNAQAQNIMKMVMDEDFSPTRMVSRFIVANGGGELTPELRDELFKWTGKATKAKEKLDNLTEKTDVAESTKGVDAAIKRAKLTPEAEAKAQSLSDRIMATLHTQADAARARMKARMANVSTGLDATMLADMTIIATEHVAQYGIDKARFVAEQLKEWGDKIAPYLDKAYEQGTIRRERMIRSADSTPEGSDAIKLKLQGLTPEQALTTLIRQLQDASSKGKSLEKMGPIINKLTDVLVRAGLTDREKLIDTIHTILKDNIGEEGLTRRQSMDAIGNYGKFRQPSLDETLNTISDLKAQMRELSKQGDIAATGKALKPGFARRANSIALQALRIRTKIAELQNRIDQGDYTTKPKPARPPRSKEVEAAQADLDQIRKEFNRRVAISRIESTSTASRAADLIPQFARFAVLTSWNVFGKLANAGIMRLVLNPTQEIIGTGLKQIPGIREIAAQAPREGYGFMWEAEKAAIIRAIKEGGPGMIDMFLHHQDQLDRMYGRPQLEGSFGELTGHAEGSSFADRAISNARTVMSFPGRTHGMLKEPVKQSEFGRSEMQRTRWMERQGLDADPKSAAMQMQYEAAYKDALRSIFLQNNMVSDGFNAILSKWESRTKEGKLVYGRLGKVGSMALQTMVPIQKVPTNVIGEALGEYLLGAPRGAGSVVANILRGRKSLRASGQTSMTVAEMAKEGARHLSNEEADAIMRQLKKGSLGMALLFAGYFNARNVGGFRQKGEVRDPDDVPANQIHLPFHVPLYSDEKNNIADTKIHHPATAVYLAGATIRRVEEALDDISGEPNGKLWGMIMTLKGLVQEVPTMREMVSVGEEFGNNNARSTIGAGVAGRVVPAGTRQVGEALDKDSEGKTIRRDPKTFLQDLQADLPILRESLDEKTPKRLRKPNVERPAPMPVIGKYLE